MRRVVPFLLSAAAVAACSPNMATDPGPLASGGAARSLGASNGTPGAVYTQSNAAAGNSLLVYDRGPDGTLTPGAVIATGGRGAGSGLGSQGSVTLSEDGEFLLVVNAGSDEVSLFRLRGTSPELLATVPSGGDQPISVTEHAGIVYVVNGGAGNNIAGFRIATTGASRTLVAIPGATRPLSAPNAGPAQIQFTPRGDAVLVTEKNTNRILSYAVDASGAAAAPVITSSPGHTPFGFAFAGNTLVVTEAQGGAPNGSTLSSYAVGANGALSLVTASLHSGQSSACWFSASKDGNNAFAANTGSSTITTVTVAPDGALALRTDGNDAATGATAIDNAVSRNGRFLYQLTSGAHEVDAYLIGSDGALTAVEVQGVPVGVVGLAVK
jgi:6-phosphogluconolactonase (cycloisomerase 2 family)